MTAFCNDVGFRFTKLEDIDRCFVSLDIRENDHRTVIPLDNGEFIRVSKNIYLPNESKRMVTDIVLTNLLCMLILWDIINFIPRQGFLLRQISQIPKGRADGICPWAER